MPKLAADPNAEAFAAALIENVELRAVAAEAVALLDKVRDLRVEIQRLAPDAGYVGIAELRSIVDTARHLVDFPMVDRCGCGWTDDDTPVQVPPARLRPLQG